jgi:hypothetical protein
MRGQTLSNSFSVVGILDSSLLFLCGKKQVIKQLYGFALSGVLGAVKGGNFGGERGAAACFAVGASPLPDNLPIVCLYVPPLFSAAGSQASVDASSSSSSSWTSDATRCKTPVQYRSWAPYRRPKRRN